MEHSAASPSLDVMQQSSAVTPLPDEHSAPADLPEKISAYFSLTFPNFTYYIQTITIAIGRRSQREGSPGSSDTHIDVDLGPQRAVSRLHAKIEYEESHERFVLVVLGRNGAWVDGIWSGSGSRVPLGVKSTIQIASRVFDFVLPPPPAPEDSPSVSSHTSASRHGSPLLEALSHSPDSSVHSPPPSKEVELPDTSGDDADPKAKNEKAPPPPKLSNKKRKKCGDSKPPPPEVMPARPQLTYAQLCYRAIKSLDGKATLQEICAWIQDNFEWYRFTDGSTWESSVRHNLSSNPGFVKMERCAGERGKGFFWSLDPLREQSLKDLDAKAGSDGTKNKHKNGKLLDPPLKRSVKGDPKAPVPPPLASTSTQPAQLIAPATKFILETPQTRKEAAASSSKAAVVKTEATPGLALATSQSTTPAVSTSTPGASAAPSMSSDVVIPIVMGKPSSPTLVPTPNPSTEITDSSTSASAKSALDLSTPPIALQNNQIVLNPTIFNSLTPAHLKELESLGARKAVEILQTYIVRYLKEKKKSEKKEKKKEKKEKKRKEGKEGDGVATLARDSAKQSDPTSTLVDTKTTLPPSQDVEQPVLSPASCIAQAVGPMRISSPPVAEEGDETMIVDAPAQENILAETEEPALKRRRLEELAGVVAGTGGDAIMV